MLESDPELNKKFREWSEGRDWFLWALGKQKPQVVAQGWQKDYLRAAKDKKQAVKEILEIKDFNKFLKDSQYSN